MNKMYLLVKICDSEINISPYVLQKLMCVGGEGQMSCPPECAPREERSLGSKCPLCGTTVHCHVIVPLLVTPLLTLALLMCFLVSYMQKAERCLLGKCTLEKFPSASIVRLWAGVQWEWINSFHETESHASPRAMAHPSLCACAQPLYGWRTANATSVLFVSAMTQLSKDSTMPGFKKGNEKTSMCNTHNVSDYI